MSKQSPARYRTTNWSRYWREHKSFDPLEATTRLHHCLFWIHPFANGKCHDAIAERGADAIIPPCKNAKLWKAITAGAVAGNEVLRASKYLGCALLRRRCGYHRWSRVEIKMHWVKLLGQHLMARDFDRQVAEFQVRVAVLNGIPVTKLVG